MKKLFFILLLILPVFLWAQNPGKNRQLVITTSFGSQNINLFKPADSTSGIKHWLIISCGGAGEVGTTFPIAHAANSIGAYQNNGTFTARFWDAHYGAFRTGYCIEVQNTSGSDLAGNLNIVRGAYNWAKANLPDMDTLQVYWSGLSLSGGVALAIAADTVLSRQFAAVIGGSPLQSVSSPQMFSGINVTHTPVRLYDANNDSNGSTSGTLGNVIFYMNGAPTNTYVPQPYAVVTTTSNAVSDHLAGWYYSMDTSAFQSLWRDSSNFFGKGSVHNVLVTDSGSFPWMLGRIAHYQFVPPPPPSAYTQAKVFDFFDGQWNDYDVNQVPWMWDNQKGGHSNVDPKNGVITDTTSVNNPAHGFLTRYGTPRNDLDIYGFTQTNKTYPYPFKTGFSRALVTLDFTGLRNTNDTTLQFVLQEVWWKDPGDTASLKIRLYNYDQQVLRKSVTSRWLYDSRPDSVCSQLDSLVSTASGNWLHIVLDSTSQRNRMRYLRLMLTSTATHHISKTPEICFYGYYTADTSLHMYSDSVRKPYAKPLYNKRDSTGIYRKKISTNVAQPVGLLSQAYDGGQRVFSSTNYYDNVNAPGIPNPITFWPASSGDFTPSIINRDKAGGKDIILSTRGGNGYTGGNVNTDAPGIEPENPNNWSRDSALFSDLTKVYGRNSAGTNRFSGTVANGQNLFPYLETGNEDYGNGYTFTANFWKARAEYRAIKQVDPTMQIIQPGMVYAGDIQQIKTIWWKTQILTTDHIFPYDILNGHYYIADQDSLGGIIHTLTEQQNSGSVPPAWAVNSNNNWLTFTDSIKRQAYTYVSDTMQFWITETGRDGYGTKPTTDAQAAVTSQYTTASVAPWDSLRVKAIWDAQQNVFGWAASADRQVNFELTSVTVNPSAQPSNQFFSSGKGDNKAITDPFDLTTFLPAWYFNASMFRLQNYYCDSVMVNGGRTGKWVFRGHHYLSTDSVVYVVFYSTKAYISSSQSFNTPSLSSGLQVLPSFTTVADTTSTFTPSFGVTTATIDMRPRMFFGKEGAPAIPSCTSNLTTTSITQTTATLNWNVAPLSTSYDVYINTTFVTNVSGTSYNATGLPAGSTVSFYVAPRNSSGVASGCSGTATTFNTLPNPPACTTNSSPANGSILTTTTSANMVWNAASGSTGYSVFFWSGSTPPTIPNGTTAGTTFYLASGLTPNTQYFFYVVPFNSGGAPSGCISSTTSYFTAAAPSSAWQPLFIYRTPFNTVTLQVTDEGGNFLLTENGLIITN